MGGSPFACQQNRGSSNQATQHYAVNDYGDQLRVVRRVTVDGDAPLSIDGRRSITRSRTPRAGQNDPGASASEARASAGA